MADVIFQNEVSSNSMTTTGVIDGPFEKSNERKNDSMWHSCEMVYEPDLITTLAEGAGYPSEIYEINEGIDNSIGAKAEIIHINVIDDYYLEIIDLGEESGMDEVAVRSNFCRYGNSSTSNENNAPGKFGIGIKAALIMLMGGREANGKFILITHKKGCKPIMLEVPVYNGVPVGPKFTFLEDSTIPYGTKIKVKSFREIKVNEIKENVSVVYCWEAIENKTKFLVNGQEILPSDPFYRNNKNIINNNAFYSKEFKIKGEKVIVNCVELTEGIIPDEEKNSFDNDNYIPKYKGYRCGKRSGIFIRTGGRYYTLGDNFNSIMGRTVHASCDGLRIEIIIPKSLWTLIGIIWNKAQHKKSFEHIPEFNTGDVDTGIYNYIDEIIAKYAAKNTTVDSKKINKKVKEIIEDASEEREYIAFETDEMNNLIEFDEETNTFHFNNEKYAELYKDDKEIALKLLAISLEYLVKSNEITLIKEIVGEINKVYE